MKQTATATATFKISKLQLCNTEPINMHQNMNYQTATATPNLPCHMSYTATAV